MIKIFDHPLINHYLTKIRDKNTHYSDFRRYINYIGELMAFTVFSSLKTKEVTIDTPVVSGVKGKEIADDVIVVPIIRAGLGIAEGFTCIFPEARIGCIGLRRNEKTFMPEEYMYKMPNVRPNSKVFVVDPMLATGGSAAKAIEEIKKYGFKDVSLVSIVGVQDGIDKVQSEHPDVDIYLATKDEKLTDKKYISPGLGDAGDRIFGTD